MSTESILKQVN